MSTLGEHGPRNTTQSIAPDLIHAGESYLDVISAVSLINPCPDFANTHNVKFDPLHSEKSLDLHRERYSSCIWAEDFTVSYSNILYEVNLNWKDKYKSTSVSKEVLLLYGKECGPDTEYISFYYHWMHTLQFYAWRPEGSPLRTRTCSGCGVSKRVLSLHTNASGGVWK